MTNYDTIIIQVTTGLITYDFIYLYTVHLFLLHNHNIWVTHRVVASHIYLKHEALWTFEMRLGRSLANHMRQCYFQYWLFIYKVQIKIVLDLLSMVTLCWQQIKHCFI